jgi:DNA-binding transcriptional LysR family regulator
LLASPAYIAAHPGSYTPSELENYNTIGFGFHSSRQITWSLSYKEQTEDIVFEPSLAINDYGAVRAALLSGKGIGELPEPLCRDDIRTGKLIEVLPGWRFPKIKFYAVHSGNASLSKLARLFLDIVFVKLKS